MERFKIVERETKTKAYSKEGLTNSARMDPAEKEKAGVQQWLNQCIDQLNIQVDQFEAEIETLSTGGKKKKGKNDDSERREECQVNITITTTMTYNYGIFIPISLLWAWFSPTELTYNVTCLFSQMWVDKHRDHIQKLETLLRMLDNDQVEVQQIKDIQEDIDNYIENSQEPDFFENEYIYADIEGLEEMLLDVSSGVLDKV